MGLSCVGLRFRNPFTPRGYIVDVQIDAEVLPKMKKLISILGLSVLLLDKTSKSVRLIITNI